VPDRIAARDLTTGIAMSFLKSETLAPLWDDFDAREDLLRQIVADRLGAKPPPSVPDHVVATYYFAFRSGILDHAV
jgi:ribulose-bisphosphate carboxylase large chain